MLLKRFSEQVEKYPSKLAVKAEDKTFTFRQLDRFSQGIAASIVHRLAPWNGAASVRQPVVSLLFRHGSLMIAALLGVLKSGGIYVPLDNTHPEMRLLYMLRHSGSVLLLTDKANLVLARSLVRQIAANPAPGVIDIESLARQEQSASPIPPGKTEARGENDIAYILYTSGSTGSPKGVYQTCGNVWYYVRNWINRFSITHRDRLTLLTAFGHDGAGQDIVAALTSGAALYPFRFDNSGSSGRLAHFLEAENITIWHSVPTLFRHFAAGLTAGGDRFSRLRYILLGGESLREQDLRIKQDYFPGSRLVNVYGQTESSVNTTAVVLPGERFNSARIGEPLDDTTLLLVDEQGKQLKKSGSGEIVVVCDYVAPGYWQDPVASDERFGKLPGGGRLFRTGDFGIMDRDGKIRLTGRKDSQVKIDGVRVETGEIETHLLEHPKIREAIVTARQDENRDNCLYAYFTADVPLAGDVLKEYLFHRLPVVMVPSVFVQVAMMPLTASGKIDRRTLAE
jgi:amino acid adenylation domain-containing protein